MSLSRQVYVISDLHLGGEYPTTPGSADRGFRICTHVPSLVGFVDRLTAKPPGAPALELVINGDTVDFLAERHATRPHWRPFIADENVAVEKLNAIMDRDDAFFAALKRFLDAGHRLVILLGNHDLELSLPRVRKALFERIGLKGRHDCAFLYDGEAYLVGDALIEHGNRYDKFNTVGNSSLRKLRACLSRRQQVPKKHRFKPPAGSTMVAEVINPIKETYRFVDLLKPETEAVIPVLLAIEPGYRRLLLKAWRARRQAARHRMAGPAMPSVGDDIASRGPSSHEAFGSDLASVGEERAASSSNEAQELRTLLAEVMGDEAEGFLKEMTASCDAGTGAGALEFGADISAWDFIDRSLGLSDLFLGRKNDKIEKRLPALARALRCLRGYDGFDVEVEPLPEYLKAARDLAKNGIRHVVFGHTHQAKRIRLESGGYYLNSGTWADVMRFPTEILSGTPGESMVKLREFAQRISAGEFSTWTLFRPTYVRLDLDASDQVAQAELCAYDETQTI